jgi:surface antigen
MKQLTIALLAAILVAPAMADPPAFAPAHGYRHKASKASKASKFRGYTGSEWEQDYGVASGHCDAGSVLAAVGAVGGAVVGNRAASPENRAVATLVGAVIGAVIGQQVGAQLDAGDRGCIGQSLEIGQIGRAVTWTNPDTHVIHVMTPVSDLAGGCRRFSYQVGQGSRPATLRACRDEHSATWVIDRD